MKFKALYAWMALPVLVMVGWVFLFYFPFSARVERYEKDLSALKADQEKVEKEIQNRLDGRVKEKQTKVSLSDLAARVPMVEQFPGYVRRVLNNAKSYGLEVDDIITTPVPAGGSKEVSVATPVWEIDLQGRFLEMGKFLEGLAESSAYRGITKARLYYDEKSYPVLKGRFVVESKVLKGRTLFEGK